MAADEGEYHSYRAPALKKPTALIPTGGLVYRLKLSEWSWIEEEDVEVEAGGHCTLHQDAIIFTSGHSYNLTSGIWSKVWIWCFPSPLF